MLTGPSIYLRARLPTDVAVLQEGLYEDIATRVRADGRAWRPMARDAASSPYAVREPSEELAMFSVVDSASDELAGEALLWSLDGHNRSAHVGLALLPQFRGRGLSHEVVDVLCRYGFTILGLQRLQVEAATDNEAMLRAATRAGFVEEGVRRQANWANGSFRDEAILGLLASEWPRTR